MKKSGRSPPWAGLTVYSASWFRKPTRPPRRLIQNQNSSFPLCWNSAAKPFAADARKTGDGKRNAFLKLLAGVIGVRYDDLRQREHARRQKRLLALAAAASVGFIAMTGLAAFALVSRAQAVHERDVARQKTITAQRTTDFVKGLFEVADPQEAQGRQITVVDALDRGARQLEGELNTSPT